VSGQSAQIVNDFPKSAPILPRLLPLPRTRR
jgi:hypothetical protein